MAQGQIPGCLMTCQAEHCVPGWQGCIIREGFLGASSSQRHMQMLCSSVSIFHSLLQPQGPRLT